MLGQQIIEEVRPASAVFGLIDWLAIPSSARTKSIGMWHGLGNVVVMLLFGVSWALRRSNPADSTTSFRRRNCPL
jgi:predicted membrane protein DUF2231